MADNPHAPAPPPGAVTVGGASSAQKAALTSPSAPAVASTPLRAAGPARSSAAAVGPPPKTAVTRRAGAAPAVAAAARGVAGPLRTPDGLASPAATLAAAAPQIPLVLSPEAPRGATASLLNLPARQAIEWRSSAAVTDIPGFLLDYFAELEAWAVANRKDSRRDALRFWALKIPAALVSAGAAVLVYLGQPGISVVASAVAGFCVLLDGMNPGGSLRNARHRAFHDLRRLQHDLMFRWRVEAWKVRTEKGREKLAAKIIKDSKSKLDRIATDLRDAESSLGVKRE
jgi:hypothetical protein